MTAAAIPFRWEGDSFVPLPRFAGQCDAAFVVGQVYRLGVVEDRSQKSHRHQFAFVREAWKNLPDELAAEFPSSEHLRKWALIKGGWADVRKFVAANNQEATRLAAYARDLDEYAVIEVTGNIVSIWTAHSQKRSEMGHTEFQRCKDAVLRIVAELIGTAAETLTANAGRAA